MKQKIMHFRLEAEDGGISPNGGMTVAIVQIDDPPAGWRAPMIGVGVAFCHPKDNYHRRLGAARAVGRAKIGAFRRDDDRLCIRAHPGEFLPNLPSSLVQFINRLGYTPATWTPACCAWHGLRFSEIKHRIELAVEDAATDARQRTLAVAPKTGV